MALPLQKSLFACGRFIFTIFSLVTVWNITTSAVFSQTWAENMFEIREHNFGNVSRYAKAEYQFKVYNPYVEDVHISSVSASCTCTSVYIQTPTIKTYETGTILAHFNTDRFTGTRGATITVVIDRPFYAVVQLHVKGVIRSDIQFQPGEVNFGNVSAGDTPEKEVKFSYYGRSSWKVTEIKSTNPAIKGELTETERNYGQVKYQLKVKIAPDAPVGYINDRIILVTNEGRNAEIPFMVQGSVRQGVTASPDSLVFGNLDPGEEITKKVIIRSEKPFALKEVFCDNKQYQFELLTKNSDTISAKNLYIVAVKFKAPDSGSPQDFTDTIKITTDAQQKPLEITTRAKINAEFEMKNAEL